MAVGVKRLGQGGIFLVEQGPKKGPTGRMKTPSMGTGLTEKGQRVRRATSAKRLSLGGWASSLTMTAVNSSF